MKAWDPSLLKGLSSNHTVIVFDPRGIGNTTIGSKPYTYQQLANGTVGLMDALKIPKAGVMGYSLGSYITQQVTMMYPDKVNILAVGPILAPYLIRGMSHDKAFAKIEVWLDRCESLRPKEPGFQGD